VGAEVCAVQSNERVKFGGLDQIDVYFPKKLKGKETAGPSVPVPGKKKAAELAQRALGGESKVILSLKELATISPMMAEELILVLWESARLKEDSSRKLSVNWQAETGKRVAGIKWAKRGKGRGPPLEAGFLGVGRSVRIGAAPVWNYSWGR
ncbi:uncharacterized protein VP01_7955g1, partial [Puccinia sorghi]